MRRIAIPALIWLACVPLCVAQEQQQQPPARRPGTYKGDPTYDKIANATGGRVYAMDPNHPVDITDILVAESTGREQVLVFAHGDLEGNRSFEGPVNDSSKQLLISVTGENTVRVQRPDGSELDANAPGVRYIPLMNGPIYLISEPDAGTWRLTLQGNGMFSAKLGLISPARKSNAAGGDDTPSSPPVETAKSAPIEFEKFRFQEVGGRPAHEGLFPIQGFPVAATKYPVEATVSGDISTIQFEFRTSEGEPLQQFRLKKVPQTGDDGWTDFSGEVLVPERAFRVYATGIDMTGHRFQVALAHEVRPQTFVVLAPRSGEWEANESMEIPVKIRNLGAADTFTVLVTEAHSIVRPPTKMEFYVGAGETKEFSLHLDVPGNGKVTSASVIITAQRASDPNAVNHAIVECSFPTAQ